MALRAEAVDMGRVEDEPNGYELTFALWKSPIANLCCGSGGECSGILEYSIA